MLKKLSAMLSVAIMSGCCIIDLSMTNTIAAAAANTTPAESVTATSYELMIGDVDANGEVDALDAASILAEAALIGTDGTGTFTEDQCFCADVNSDGAVTAVDASIVLAYATYVGAGGSEDFAYYLENRDIIDGEVAEDPTEPVTDPTEPPTEEPTEAPTEEPTTEPTTEPTPAPTPEPTTEPTTEAPTEAAPIVNLTTDEAKLLAALVTLEAGSESYECQKAVASLVINRMWTSNKTLSEVIYEKNQFSVASKVASTTPFTSCVNAVNDVMYNGTTLPIYVTFFRASYYHTWGDQVPYCYIDNTYFSYSQALKNKYV